MRDFKELISSYDNFPQEGIIFRDTLRILQNPNIFNELISRMSSNDFIRDADAILSIDARGFIFGTAISMKISKPMIFARKTGKLPGKLSSQEYKLEYGKDQLSIQKNSLDRFRSFAIIDDLLATGGTALAAIELVNMFENKNIIGAGFIINLPELKGDLKLINKGINIHSLMEF